MSKKLKAIWVSEETHSCIKTAAAAQKKKMNEYLKDIGETTRNEFKPVQRTTNKWRFI